MLFEFLCWVSLNMFGNRCLHCQLVLAEENVITRHSCLYVDMNVYNGY